MLTFYIMIQVAIDVLAGEYVLAPSVRLMSTRGFAELQMNYIRLWYPPGRLRHYMQT